jgi:hypothetical protein
VLTSTIKNVEITVSNSLSCLASNSSFQVFHGIHFRREKFYSILCVVHRSKIFTVHGNADNLRVGKDILLLQTLNSRHLLVTLPFINRVQHITVFDYR